MTPPRRSVRTPRSRRRPSRAGPAAPSGPHAVRPSSSASGEPGHNRPMSADAGLRGAPGAGEPAPQPAAGSPQAPGEPVASAAPAPPAPLRPSRSATGPSPPSPVASHSSSAASRSSASTAPASRALDFTIWWVASARGPGRRGPVRAAAAALLAYAGAPRMRRWRRWSTVGLCVAFAVVTAWNGVDFYRAWQSGQLHAGLPIPLSFVVCALLLFIAWAAFRPPAPRRRRLAAAAVLVVTAAACVLLFPVAQVFFFGKTDYRRSADVAVVFGARCTRTGGLDFSQQPDDDGDRSLQGPPREAHPRLRRRGGQRVQRDDRDARHRARPACLPTTWSSTPTE